MTRIYRSSRDRVLTGVCGGLSDATGMDSTWIRILVVISFFITAGTTFMIYVIAALVISKEPRSPYEGGFGPDSGPYTQQDPRYYGGSNTRTQYGQGTGYNQGGAYGNSNPFGQDARYSSKFNAGHNSDLDSMMEDIEKKAMKKELEELRKKVEQFEKGERK
ncbi:PspC domain-containing protein [Paenibacillus polymyxa]|uniref:PspC domain-containing protein n=1 Tax=Paenibacillus polymyxa TaxID=1406 RepID=UPI000D3129D5|nr:PspC domain-containing protein [Paenibacillus polymyxa]MDU8672926.1 PspC domain-containing protein [Paenibacillus polymyxa]MDU8697833.1 PspC domain-containing protein [Paenibacillus polymyxa]MEE4579634.1 PspC domain-containing protein [Paenibacillus polymyxa]PTU45549.1 stress-responsive transcriptional regulator [Paenibacillus polymyxa]UNL93878.1 stress-responsive transcriptional regulator [Paenibacillus polymyxa]